MFTAITLSLITITILISILSISLIFLLRLKTRTSPHLHSFNSLWSLRLLLVLFVSLLAISQLLALGFFCQQHCVYEFFPTLTKISLCKIHIVLSLGFLEPGFLITLLFLVTISTREYNLPRRNSSLIITLVFATCLPLLLLQIFFVFFSPAMVPLPEVFYRHYFTFNDNLGKETMLCVYPLPSTVFFGAFGLTYSVWFMLSCFRLVSLVINKNLRARIYVLAFTVCISLVMQILLLGLSLLLKPNEVVHSVVSFAVFVTTLACAAAGEAILVIRPIADALAVGGGDISPQLFRQAETVVEGGALKEAIFCS